MHAQLTTASQILAKTAMTHLPEEVLYLQEELQKKYPNSVTLANLIGHNPELLGDFLTLVNSGITREDNEIKDAKAAVNLLGLDEISNLFLASSLCRNIAQTPLEKTILNHGAQAGLAAAELSFWVYGVSRSEAYLAGLMQNIGAVYLSRLYPKQYETLYYRHLSQPFDCLDSEHEFYHTDHTQLSLLVAKKWHMDPCLYKALFLHHDPDFIAKTAQHSKVRALTALIMVANFVVAGAQEEGYINQELKQYRDAGLKALNLPDNALLAAQAAVVKWGKSMHTTPGGH
jgi:HD-like signal output (HDOD) protein